MSVSRKKFTLCLRTRRGRKAKGMEGEEKRGKERVIFCLFGLFGKRRGKAMGGKLVLLKSGKGRKEVSLYFYNYRMLNLKKKS